MEYKETKLAGVYILEPRIFNDARGYFYEVWKEDDFKQHVSDVHFVQDNESKSSYGVCVDCIIRRVIMRKLN